MVASYATRVARSGRAAHPRLGPSPGSALLPGWLVEAFYWAFHAPGRALVALHVSPDACTYASLVFCCASLPLAATGRFAEAAAVIIVGAILDALDGMVARARGIASPSGAVLDSFVDRIADAAPFIGLAIYYRHNVVSLVIPLAAMVASSLVSYARAKADQHGLVLPNGLMRRHERVVYLSASLFLGPVIPYTQALGGIPRPLTLLGVGLVAVVGTVASFVLVARTRAALRDPRLVTAKSPRPEFAPKSAEPRGPLPVEH
ncbi:CDP-alcohol phosphatidyltransferase family protein [Polyangium spumosum]|uniref:CDP-alcohol phosphatidyltransferase family protein n=1 Tax=Polyangium spumosum TaxID=889282 RepID=A0A6N7PFS1_9BACT|nr:CDP-alcohol phosphatidyltransferase family protein [Polyangium spumosum]